MYILIDISIDNQQWFLIVSLFDLLKKQKIKLSPLSTFDGNFKIWLFFKNAFHNVTGSQTDLSDIDKLHYLKLIGEAASKVKIFETEGINFPTHEIR